MTESVATQESDAELLAEFVAKRNEAPFEVLVRRYGALVYGVCLRTTGQRQDAEDATQAVFLTLALKAKSLSGRSSIAGWLHRTAWNIGRRARAAAGAKRSVEAEAVRVSSNDTVPNEDEVNALKQLLDEELDRLPDKYRLPLVLHYLESLTKDETARALNENAGTISARLDRARELLRERMTRRGVSLTSAAFSAGLLSVAVAQLPAELASVTVKSATIAAVTGKLASGVASGHVTALARGAVGMGISKTFVIVVALVILCSAGSLAFVQQRNRKSREAATLNLIKAIETAASAYEFDFGVYPPDVAPNGAKSSAALYYYLLTPFRVKPNTQKDEVSASKDVGPYLDPSRFQFTRREPNGNITILDAWGQPLEYNCIRDGSFTKRGDDDPRTDGRGHNSQGFDVFSRGEPGAHAPIANFKLDGE